MKKLITVVLLTMFLASCGVQKNCVKTDTDCCTEKTEIKDVRQ